MAIRSVVFSPQHALQKARDVVAQNWYLGFTAFGGPPVHFKIVSFFGCFVLLS
jgi:hypothetical protein